MAYTYEFTTLTNGVNIKVSKDGTLVAERDILGSVAAKLEKDFTDGVATSLTLSIPDALLAYVFYFSGNTFIVDSVTKAGASTIQSALRALFPKANPGTGGTGVSQSYVDGADTYLLGQINLAKNDIVSEQTARENADTDLATDIKNTWWDSIKAAAQIFTNYLTAKGIKISGTAGAGYVEVVSQSASPATPGSGIMRIFSDASGRLAWITQLGFVRAFRSASLTANRTYTLQDRDGQLADDTSIDISGTAGGGYIGFSAQSSAPSTPSSGFRLFANSLGKLVWKGANGFIRVFDGTANTADRTYTLPDADTTIVGTDASQTLTNKTFSGSIKTTGSLPGVAVGAGAGTSPSISNTGNDIVGSVTLTMGTSPSSASDLFTLTFSATLPSTPKAIIMSAGNANAALLITRWYLDQATVSTTVFKVKCGSTALTSALPYIFYYQVIL